MFCPVLQIEGAWGEKQMSKVFLSIKRKKDFNACQKNAASIFLQA